MSWTHGTNNAVLVYLKIIISTLRKKRSKEYFRAWDGVASRIPQVPDAGSRRGDGS